MQLLFKLKRTCSRQTKWCTRNHRIIPVLLDLRYSDNEVDLDSGKVEILVAEDNDELREYLVRELRKEFSVLRNERWKRGIGYCFRKESLPHYQ